MIMSIQRMFAPPKVPNQLPPGVADDVGKHTETEFDEDQDENEEDEDSLESPDDDNDFA